jgi:hypothetical protein
LPGGGAGRSTMVALLKGMMLIEFIAYPSPFRQGRRPYPISTIRLPQGAGSGTL